ncbi:MAG: hypothetical protein DMG86_08250 [Acidobacteria bacterium]|nr:MAG: hypothetical protein AUI17_08150 [Acidobacteriales bacterium 13_2_20CM_2_55_5]OLD17168.1 MAG: hypothetical protein AUI85_07615 [Acidobacteriales bacterium 13_1_40CM_3_55_5]PYX02127.1 MAG: hypothetical protein DMG86_08250 [Acidobacteriota bacterium]PYX05668.1 MAG: hypothetical protein DMG85_14875 [Acidobacteriota bacterium]PYX18194.1 MAG: hypothetical protein DMG84_00610 [Acidobacteriota bacterium]
MSWLQKNNSKLEQSGILAQNFSATRKSSALVFFRYDSAREENFLSSIEVVTATAVVQTEV